MIWIEILCLVATNMLEMALLPLEKWDHHRIRWKLSVVHLENSMWCQRSAADYETLLDLPSA